MNFQKRGRECVSLWERCAEICGVMESMGGREGVGES